VRRVTRLSAAKKPASTRISVSRRLRRASRERLLVKLTRPFEDGWIEGYVFDIGPQFFLLALVNGEIRFNGFSCIRTTDVRNLQVPAKYSAFIQAALKKRGERRPKRPSVSVVGLSELLLSANKAFPLVTIHREIVDPEVCHIGRIVGISNGRVSLLEIGPNALWDKEISEYRLREITRVDFGGGYEEALNLVGGTPAGD
jgi:hypothetical protein